MRGDAHYQRLTGSHLVVANSAAVLFHIQTQSICEG